MEQLKLYKIKRVSGAVRVTVNPPSEDLIPFGVRLIADEGKAITKDGVNLFTVKDEPFVEGEGTVEEKVAATAALWQEVEAPAEWRVRDE